jgi:hypothetical protein
LKPTVGTSAPAADSLSGGTMARRGPQSFKKRQKEQQRKEKQQEKIAKRLERKLHVKTSTESEVQLPEADGAKSS